ncbi:MAG: crotonase/enoyl-CoA hydratase family protein [Pseudomonadota bacterium]
MTIVHQQLTATGIGVVTLDDGKANAVNHELLDELEQALDALEGTAKAVVLAGRPGRFSAGFDLSVMRGGDSAALVQRGGRLLHRLYGFPLPIVAAVSGHALAMGALLCLASDTRIGVAGDFKLGLNETAIGMVLPDFGLILARERLQPHRLTEAIIQARVFGPEDAAGVGYLDRVVQAADLAAAALAEAEALAELPGPVYGRIKQAARRQALADLERSLSG